MAVLSPLLPPFLRAVEGIAAKVEDGEDVGQAVCQSVVDGAERIYEDAVGLGGAVYGFAVLVITFFFVGVENIF